MPKVIATGRDGEEQTFVAPADQSLMVALRDHGNGVVDENFGLCCGSCSCYTCHVWIDEECLAHLAPPSSQEADLLGLASHRQPNSRLGCQITLSDALDGLRVAIPPAA